jgi:endonuclease YncB( thermonuclease family)
LKSWEYTGYVGRVIDGDTIEADCDLGFYMGCRQRFRLLAFNAPENQGDTKDKAAAATAALSGIVFGELPHEIKIRTYKADSFGRWLCTIELQNGADLGFILHCRGFGTWEPKHWEKYRGTDDPRGNTNSNSGGA